MKQLFEIRFFFLQRMQMQNGFGTHEIQHKKHMHIIIRQQNCAHSIARPKEKKQRLFNAKNWNIHYVFCINISLSCFFFVSSYFVFHSLQHNGIAEKKTQL